MAEKKSIVIKIKHPNLPLDAEIRGVAVTQWHLPRIFMAVTLFLVVLAGIFYLVVQGLSDDGRPKPVQDPSAKASPAVRSGPGHHAGMGGLPVDEAIPALGKPSVKGPGRVRRALLVSSIIGKEPGQELPDVIHAAIGQPMAVYYFTELRGMDGQTVYHLWLHNGKVIDRRPQQIAADRWRTSSQQQITSKSAGDWQVKTIDSQGRLLNELRFQVK